jgi:putative ABC transport system permease protein
MAMLRFLRPFQRRPGLVFAAVGILALAIGAATAVFALVDAVVIRPLPFRDPGRLVWMWNARTERDRAPFSVLDLDDYRRQNHVLVSLAGFMNWTVNLTGVGEAERLEAIRVAPEFFDVLGTDAAYGSVFHAGDDPAERVLVITDRLWRRRFSADTSVVGRRVELSGVPYTVVGILPGGFVFPFRDAELASPLAISSDPRSTQRSWGLLRVIARIKPGVTLDAAKRDLDVIGHRLQREYPIDDAKRTGVNLYPLQREIVGDARQSLLALMAAVLFVLVIAAANVANLLLVWLAARRGELQICTALGASRGRLIGQIATHAGLLVIAGGVAGVWVASMLIPVLVWWTGSALPLADGAHIETVTVVFAIVATGIVAVVCVVVPAIQATTRFECMPKSRDTTAPRERQRLRRALVALQMAIAFTLLAAIGLTVRSLLNLQHVKIGFRPQGTLSVQLSLPIARYSSAAALSQFTDALTPRILSLPGVRSAALVSLLPLSGLLRAEDFRIVGRPEPPPNEVPQAHYRVVTPQYFQTMGVAMLEGREFTDDDRRNTASVAIVSQRLAQESWPGASPIGSRLRLANGDLNIIGEAANVKQLTLEGAPTADLYVPLRQMPESEAPLVAARTFWVVATHGDPAQLVERVRAQVHGLDGEIAASGTRTLESIVSDAIAPRRFNAAVLAAFGQIALLLAAAGLYAVSACSVQQRTREIGVRMALGAKRRDVILLVLGSEWRAMAIGALGGIAGGFAVARLLASTLYQVGSIDLGTVTASLAALVGMAVAGCYLPARRAAQIDPIEALR